LRYAGGRPLVVVGCDMPFVGAALLAWLASTSEPLVVPSLGGNPQPLPARYDDSLLPALEDALAGAASLRRTIESLQPRLVAEDVLARFGDPTRLCFNVNTPTDLEAAERMLKAVEGRA
jgi:molybdopterin-guanine dinucleotide biosynthesis protein A